MTVNCPPALVVALTLTPASNAEPALRTPLTLDAWNEWSAPVYGSCGLKSTSVVVPTLSPATTIGVGASSPGTESGSGMRVVVNVRTRSV